MSAEGGHRLCRLDDIENPGGKGFVLGSGTARREVFVVRKGELVVAYENACPHIGTPLDTFPDRFLDPDAALIVCSTHGARFRIADGFCVRGPCKGDSLRPLMLKVENKEIIVDLSDNPVA